MPLTILKLFRNVRQGPRSLTRGLCYARPGEAWKGPLSSTGRQVKGRYLSTPVPRHSTIAADIYPVMHRVTQSWGDAVTTNIRNSQTNPRPRSGDPPVLTTLAPHTKKIKKKSQYIHHPSARPWETLVLWKKIIKKAERLSLILGVLCIISRTMAFL